MLLLLLLLLLRVLLASFFAERLGSILLASFKSKPATTAQRPRTISTLEEVSVVDSGEVAESVLAERTLQKQNQNQTNRKTKKVD